jgi:hypothetical protein
MSNMKQPSPLLVKEKQQDLRLVAGVVEDISNLEDPNTALLYVNSRLIAWRHNLFHKCFKNTLEAIPASLPSNWTRAEATEFFAALVAALEKDTAALNETCADES